MGARAWPTNKSDGTHAGSPHTLDCGIDHLRATRQGPENDGCWLGSSRTAGAPEVAAPISAKRAIEELLAPLATQNKQPALCYAPNYGALLASAASS